MVFFLTDGRPTVGDLTSTDDRHHRAGGLVERLAERVKLGRQQRPGAGHRREATGAMGRRLRAVGGAKGVHHEHVAERGHPARHRER